MGTTLPERGRSWDGLREEMLAMRREDLDWRRGRHSVYVWYADDALCLDEERARASSDPGAARYA